MAGCHQPPPANLGERYDRLPEIVQIGIQWAITSAVLGLVVVLGLLVFVK